MKRKAYLRLRERYRRRKKSFVYVDESGFEPEVVRRYGRTSRGQKVYGLRPGNSPYGQKTQHPLLKYRETQLPNFGKQIYNRFYGKEGLGVNDVSR
jgi:hypothetical protein